MTFATVWKTIGKTIVYEEIAIILVQSPLEGGTIFSTVFFVQTILYDQYIHRRAL